jgi:hypothetical protein
MTQHRRRVKQTRSLEDRLAEQARRLHEEAELLPTDLYVTRPCVELAKPRSART